MSTIEWTGATLNPSTVYGPGTYGEPRPGCAYACNWSPLPGQVTP
jgi:hypothetical protein